VSVLLLIGFEGVLKSKPNGLKNPLLAIALSLSSLSGTTEALWLSFVAGVLISMGCAGLGCVDTGEANGTDRGEKVMEGMEIHLLLRLLRRM
jgi:hypothetical protein